MHDSSPALSLPSYQKQMQALLLHEPDADATPLQMWLENSNDSAERKRGLAVYRNNVMYSLVNALAAQFPIVERLTGKDFFGALARDFVCLHPPVEASLTFYGEQLPGFIQNHLQCTALPWLGDVARLEWLCQYALHAAEAPLLEIGDLMAVPPEKLGDVILNPQPSVQLLSSRWAVQRIHEENLKPEPELLSLDCDASTHLLVYRKDNTVQIVTLQAPMYALLEALLQRKALQQAWEQIQPRFALPDDELIPLLVHLLRLQIFRN